MSQLLWQPTPEQIAASNMTAFMQYVNRKYQLFIQDYNQLYQWSIDRPADFWAAMWEFGGVIFSRPYSRVVTDLDKMPGARWFLDARLNFAQNLLRYRDEQTALIFQGEGRPAEKISYAGLYDLVSRTARALEALGVKQGDRVVGFMPNMIQTVVAMLAATSLGAIWSSCSPDFGIKGVLDRFGQIAPKVLFTADGYFYGGKVFDSLERVRGLLPELPSIEKVVVVPYAQPEPDLCALPGAVLWEDFLAPHPAGEMEFVQLPFDHPLYIMYSSGTTGIPKCIVHGAGGTLIQHLKELLLHTDLKRSDTIFYYTTCGWMMWNWLVSSLAVGATVVLYDGSPFHPHPGALFEMAEKQGITVFGTSAKYLAAVEKEGVRPGKQYDLSALRAVLSTGSPLSIESFYYVYREIKPDLQLASISGGTDIISCFALGNPTGPVYAGQLQCRGLGMKVEAFDEQGRSVLGQKGELVCTMPFPSMPLGFWNDPEGKKYRAAYFDYYPNVWRHGDYVEITPQNGVIIYGRSDATLNPGGVRIGTAEIYRQVETLPEVLDSIVVGQDWQGDVRVILFVKLAPGVELTEELQHKIRRTIRENTTPRHVPAKILTVPDIPYTINGKKVELAVRNVIHGQPVLNQDALANPEALAYFAGRTELES
ncbi:acetoacetate--CoA ligase [Desulfurispora thermophila]|uniref:acetoacetate--CoA ligase n=1 Tax=Desulfurispora thermophila TaxID=265470 RepID=UPI0003714D03|nr:acetoacetate--CoA ligase [Desulfurispora thermophila]